MDINLLPVNLRKKAGRIGYYTMFVLAGLLILSVLAWGGGSILHQKLVLNRLDSEIKRLGSEVATVDRLQAVLKELEDRIDYVNALRQSHVPVLNILRDLSKEIPESAWIRRIAFSDKGVEIEGYANSASELISLLEAAPLFKDVAFLSPITKGKDGKEKFRIGFKVNKSCPVPKNLNF
jgi:general secretion pathway protein L